MHPLLILLLGVLIVIGGILILRLHAFLALTLAALTVGVLTPTARIERFELKRNALPVRVAPLEGAAATEDLWVLSDPDASEEVPVDPAVDWTWAYPGRRLEVVRPTGDGMQRVGRFTLLAEPTTGELPPGALAARLTEGTFDPGSDLLVTTEVAEEASAAAEQTIGERLARAFGNTCGNIGILIALAAVIGKCLLDSGGADRIVRAALAVVGQRGAPVAFVGSGFVLGIPVFFDTVFYLMMPLGKAMYLRTRGNYLLYVLTIVAGATMAHSLVPPTPGPLLVAESLDVDLGVMILAGCLVGLCSSSVGLLYAMVMNRRFEVPLRESADFSLEELEALSSRDVRELPSLLESVAPILLPVILIAGNTVVTSAGWLDDRPQAASLLATLGNKNIALILAAALAMITYVRFRRPDRATFSTAMQGALASGGLIILITAAGGAFGAMLQRSGVVELVGLMQTGSTTLVLVLAFLITTGIRTAQGSATVAMITAVGILAPLGGDLGCHPVYLALAIGCGSKPVAWMNDSGFWVICKMSGMTEAEGLRYVTPMSILMGISGLLATLAAAATFPLS